MSGSTIHRRAVPWLALALLGLGSAEAISQSAKDENIAIRSRPEFSPLGMELDHLLSVVGLVDKRTVSAKSSPLSSFIVFPSLGLSLSHDDNLFRTPDNEAADNIVEVSPGVTVQSDWANHALSLSAEAKIGRHADNRQEDFTDYTLTAQGKIELTDAWSFAPVLVRHRGHEQRGDIDDPGAAFAPTLFAKTNLKLKGEYDGDPIRGHVELDLQRVDFEDSGTLDNDERDRFENKATGRLSYAVTDLTSVFFTPTYNWRVYDQERDNAGVLQDSHGFELLAGANIDITGTLFAELSAGYFRQTFDDPRFQPAAGPSFNGTIYWNPTDLLSVTGTANRKVEETRAENISSVITTNFALKFDYEYDYNLLFAVDLSYSASAFEGVDRDDDGYVIGLTTQYLIGPNLSFLVSVTRNRRNSTDPTVEFAATTIIARLTGRL